MDQIKIDFGNRNKMLPIILYVHNVQNPGCNILKKNIDILLHYFKSDNVKYSAYNYLSEISSMGFVIKKYTGKNILECSECKVQTDNFYTIEEMKKIIHKSYCNIKLTNLSITSATDLVLKNKSNNIPEIYTCSRNPVVNFFYTLCRYCYSEITVYNNCPERHKTMCEYCADIVEKINCHVCGLYI